MSKLSIRIGISMVAPPIIAAGELNCSLVDETERIILDICRRCHCILYLMCYVSIDSSAPERKDNSSIILSVIDEIKDVPNL